MALSPSTAETSERVNPRILLRAASMAVAGVTIIAILAGCFVDGETSPRNVSSGNTMNDNETVNSTEAPIPVVEGNRLINDRTGEAWTPQGMNWPSFEYACAQGYAYSQQGRNKETAEALRNDWNADTVRLTFNQDCWLGTNFAPAQPLETEKYRKAIKSFVKDLNDSGIAVIIALHSVKANTAESFGLISMPNTNSQQFWASVAQQFKDYPSVMFDAFNEPYSIWSEYDGEWLFELSWDCWANGGCTPPVETDAVLPPLSGETYTAVGMNQLVAEIRNAGATQPIILSGIDYANDLREWLTYRPDDDQLIAGLHSYPFQRCNTTSCWDSEIGSLTSQVPVIIAEFGEADEGTAFVEQIMPWAKTHQVGYLAWAWYIDQENEFTLISDESGTPRQGTGAAIHGFFQNDSGSTQND